jgi:hypothetical protein
MRRVIAVVLTLVSLTVMSGCKDKSTASASSVAPPTATASATPVVPTTVTRAWCEGPLRARMRARFLSDGAALYPERDPDFRQKVVDEAVTNIIAKCLKADGTPTDPTWSCYWDSSLKTYRDCDNARKKSAGVGVSLGVTLDTFKQKWNASAMEHGDKTGFTLGEPKSAAAGTVVFALAPDADLILVTNAPDTSVRSVVISSPSSGEEFFEVPASTTYNTRLLAWRRALETLVPDITAKQRRELDEEVVGLGRGGPVKDKPARASVTRLGLKLERFDKDGRRVLKVSDPSDAE